MNETISDELRSLIPCRCCGERCSSMLQCLLRGVPEKQQFAVCAACAYEEVDGDSSVLSERERIHKALTEKIAYYEASYYRDGLSRDTRQQVHFELMGLRTAMRIVEAQSKRNREQEAT